MTNRRKTTSDRLTHIRAYLEKKNKPELVALMLDLVQEMDEPTRQRFWEHLARPEWLPLICAIPRLRISCPS